MGKRGRGNFRSPDNTSSPSRLGFNIRSDDEFSSANGSDVETGVSSESNKNLTISDNDGNGFEYLIPFINKLHTIFRNSGISADCLQLPQIVVVGSQSHGKSSVLESLVGKSFLPRGTGIVTRCPIVLKLIQTKTSKEWCEFVHNPKKRYYDFKAVQQEILDQTQKLAGQFGISRESIQLTVNSPNVVKLTVVDLPGIVKVPKFDQPVDIEKQIRELILEYITPRNTIILAISAANNDIGTSESIKFARKVDPDGVRTMAVITMLDLARDKAQIMEVLKGQAIPNIQVGVIGVINRNQEEIEGNKTMQDALESEKKYLVATYPSIASQHGTPFLARRLNRELLKHIELCFPELDMRLKQLEIAYKGTLEELGHPMEDEEKRGKLIDMLDEFSTAYKGQIYGSCRRIDITKAGGAARIDYIFQVRLINGLKELSPLEGLTDRQIIIAISSRQTGSKQFILEDAFRELARRQIGKMLPPVLDCANQVYHEMINMVLKCLDKSAERFPKLNRAIIHILSEILHHKVQHARQVLEQFIDIQSTSAITAQSDFYDLMENVTKGIQVIGLGKLPLDFLVDGDNDPLFKKSLSTSNPVPDEPEDTNPMTSADTTNDEHQARSTQQRTESSAGNIRPPNANGLNAEQLEACKAIRKLMVEFFSIVLKQVEDYTPNSILFTIVYSTADNVEKDLMKQLLLPEKIAELMKESDRIISVREAVRNDLQTLEEACQLLEEVREKSAF